MAAIKRTITGTPGYITLVTPSDTNRLSTTTPTADPTLTFTMEVGAYYIDLFVNIYVRSTPDFKYTLTLPTGFFRSMQSIVAQNTTITQTIITAAPTNVALTTSVDNYGFIRITGPYATSTGGTFSFDWSQNTSNGSDAATVVQGSFLQYFRFN
jgi:hypothetical protein